MSKGPVRTSVDQATLVAEKLRVAVARLKMLHEASTYGVVTISIGVARGDTGEGLADDRLREADRMLYRAKADGRNCIRGGPAVYSERGGDLDFGRRIHSDGRAQT